jgi:hypothetical protein
VIIANTVTMASLNMRDPEAQNADGMAETGVREHDTVRGGGAGEDRGPRVLAGDQGAYMDSGWNQFDFVLVLGHAREPVRELRLGTQFLALRAFRCFRPAARDEELPGRAAA